MEAEARDGQRGRVRQELKLRSDGVTVPKNYMGQCMVLTAACGSACSGGPGAQLPGRQELGEEQDVSLGAARSRPLLSS